MQTIKSLDKILTNEPKFRIEQIKKLIWHNFITYWNKATSLPKQLKEILEKEFSLEITSTIQKDKKIKKQKC